MQIHLRLGKLKEPVVQIVDCHSFSTKKSFSISICPLPSFLKDAKCNCGNEADFILNGIKCMCLDCLNKKFKGATTSMITFKDISIPLTKRTIVRIKFEWSVDGERWYTAYGRNLVTKDWNALLGKMRSMIINDTFIMLNADYDKEKKRLKIF